jgi:hypothetical protein
VRIVRLALCLRLQRAGLGADVMGTGPSSEGARVGAFMLTTLSGFWKSEAILATSLLGPMPTEAVSPSWLTDLRLEPAGALDCGVEAAERRELEIRFVDAGLLEGVAGGDEDRHDPRRDFPVERVIVTDKDRLGLAPATRGLRQAPGSRDRQGRADAVPSGRVARRRHDASAVAFLGIGSDNERPTS